MLITDRLADDVRRAAEGDPWYGLSVKLVLEGVDADRAAARVPGASHSIWEIVLHTTVWARYMAKRVAGEPPHDPVEGNWPAVEAVNEAAWDGAVADVMRAHRELVQALGTADERALDEVTDATPVDGFGEPVTVARGVAGVAQHTAYHCGQIAVLKQMLGIAPKAR
jgi:uncharacterized damage-inducible protein DinB